MRNYQVLMERLDVILTMLVGDFDVRDRIGMEFMLVPFQGFAFHGLQ